MTPNRRYVFDTNVLISAVLVAQSIPHRAIDYALTSGRILLSHEVAQEIQRIFSLEKFSRYVTAEDRDRFLWALVQETECVEVIEPIHVCRDFQDNKLLELAVNGHASHLITGDADLLVLHPFRGIHIVTPQVFVSAFEAR